MKNGQGSFVFPDGSSYMGNWVDDRMTGKGMLQSKLGEVIYDGNFKENHMDGQGVYYNTDTDHSPSSY
jgi:hypothetical protein